MSEGRVRRAAALGLKGLLLIGAGAAVFLALALFGLSPPPADLPPDAFGGGAPLEVLVLDVGQGAAALVRTPEKTLLIDCGDRGGEAAADGVLGALGVRRLDALVITHPHSDHMGIAPHLLRSYAVGELLVPELPGRFVPATDLFADMLSAAERADVTVRAARAGDTLDLGGGAELAFIGPVYPQAAEELNDVSLCMLLRLGDACVFITGDAEAPSEQAMLEAGRLAPCDVLVVGHHGGGTSTTRPFLAAVAPKAAVISAGADNPYGHPHESTLRRLAAVGADIYRTDLDGSVRIATDGNRLIITAARREQKLAA